MKSYHLVLLVAVASLGSGAAGFLVGSQQVPRESQPIAQHPEAPEPVRPPLSNTTAARSVDADRSVNPDPSVAPMRIPSSTSSLIKELAERLATDLRVGVRGGKVVGTVVDEEGKPIAGAQNRAVQSRSAMGAEFELLRRLRRHLHGLDFEPVDFATTTDELGRYEIDDVQVGSTLTISAQGQTHGTGRGRATVLQEIEVRVPPIVLERTYPTRFLVRLPDGTQPLSAHLQVQSHGRRSDGQSQTQALFKWTPNDNLHGVLPGQNTATARLTIGGVPFQATSAPFEVSPDSAIAEVVLDLAAEMEVLVTIVDESGKPISPTIDESGVHRPRRGRRTAPTLQLERLLSGKPDPNWRGGFVSTGDGVRSLSRVSTPGTYRVSLINPHQPERQSVKEFTLESGQRIEIDLTIPRPDRHNVVHVTLHDHQGALVTGSVRFGVESEESPYPSIAEVATELTDGRVHIVPLPIANRSGSAIQPPPKKWLVHARLENGSQALGWVEAGPAPTLTLRAEQSFRLDVSVEGSRKDEVASIILLRASGDGWENAERSSLRSTVLQGETPNWLRTPERTDSSTTPSSRSWQGLAPGKYQVQVRLKSPKWHPRATDDETTVVLAEVDATRDLDLKLQLPLLHTLIVRSPAEETPNSRVSATPVSAGAARDGAIATAGWVDGTSRLQALPVGRYVLSCGKFQMLVSVPNDSDVTLSSAPHNAVLIVDSLRGLREPPLERMDPNIPWRHGDLITHIDGQPLTRESFEESWRSARRTEHPEAHPKRVTLIRDGAVLDVPLGTGRAQWMRWFNFKMWFQ